MMAERVLKTNFEEVLDIVSETPQAVSTFPDFRLCELLHHLNIIPAQTIPALLGECHFRLDIYGARTPPTLAKTFQQAWSSHDNAGHISLATTISAARRKHWMAAHGLILLAWNQKEDTCASFLPFTLEKTRDGATRVIDMNGMPGPDEWCDALGKATWLPSSRSVRLLSPLGPLQEKLQGESFLMPVWIIYMLQSSGRKPRSPISFAASGILREGLLVPANYEECKKDICHQLGIKFLSPKDLHRTSDCNAPNEQLAAAYSEIFSLIRHETECDTNNPMDYLRSLDALPQDLRAGRISLEDARIALDDIGRRIQTFLSHDSVVEDLKKQWVACDFNLRNHEGRGKPPGSYPIDTRAIKYSQVKSQADHVVDLIDKGTFQMAEQLSRRLYAEVHSDSFDTMSEDKYRCRMITAGVLGGQTLLQQMLFKPAYIEESRKLLNEALNNARLLRSGPDCALDITQLALWTAMAEPHHINEAYEWARKELNEWPADDVTASLAYLERIRLFGAYRLYITQQTIMEEADTWPLPGGPSWLLATALKYLGTLAAAKENFDYAGECFQRAIMLLKNVETGFILDFIRGTIALQAAESLIDAHPTEAESYAHRALNIFKCHLGRVEGPLATHLWISHAQVLLKDRRKNVDEIIPQKLFCY